MDGWIDAERVFRKYSECREDGVPPTLTLFSLRLALISLLGEVPSSQVSMKKTLSRVSPSWEQDGVTREAFMSLLTEYNQKTEEEMTFEAFLQFDPLRKGYISLEEFVKAVNQVAPSMPLQRTENIFRSADEYKIGKITFQQFKKLMKAERNFA